VSGDGGVDGARRRLLAAGGALALAGTAGCLGRARRSLSGPIVADAGSSHAHSADRPFLRDGLDASDEPGTWRVHLVTAPPARSLLTPAGEASTMAEFGAEGYDGRWAVYVEYRTVREEAVTVGWRTEGDETWTGWREARTPMVAEPLDVDPPDVDGATELVVTSRVWYESRPSPTGVRVPVYEADSERVLYEGRASASPTPSP
jgi:hypothetical protein